MANFDKIKSLDFFSQVIVEAKKSGKKIALCHGTFDLLHIGHVRYFKEARKYGDILIVTLTADEFVLKGADRPIFNESLRAEMIAALEYVDYVSIVKDKTAIPAIEAIKPDYYVKGSEYKDSLNDITGKIIDEEKCLKKYHGQLVFTDDIVFSSSNLLNNNFATTKNEKISSIVNQIKEKGGMDYIQQAVESIKNLKILFIGETIIDEYCYVSILGKASKESIICTQYKENEIFAGGVIAAAKHLSDFCNNIRVLTTFGDLDSHEHTVKSTIHDKIDIDYIKLSERPTIRKQRFVDASYFRKMYEVYYMDDTPLLPEQENNLRRKLSRHLTWADIVIVNDFGHGCISPKMINDICMKANFLALNVQTNSGNRGFNSFNKYRKANFLCIDEPEIRLAVADKYSSVEILLQNNLSSLIDCSKAIVTHGKFGSYAFDEQEKVQKIPALTTKVLDSIGAGDSFLSISSPFAYLNLPLNEVALFGNIAGAIKVNIVGHRSSVDKVTFLKYLDTLLK